MTAPLGYPCPVCEHTVRVTSHIPPDPSRDLPAVVYLAHHYVGDVSAHVDVFGRDDLSRIAPAPVFQVCRGSSRGIVVRS